MNENKKIITVSRGSLLVLTLLVPPSSLLFQYGDEEVFRKLAPPIGQIDKLLIITGFIWLPFRSKSIAFSFRNIYE